MASIYSLNSSAGLSPQQIVLLQEQIKIYKTLTERCKNNVNIPKSHLAGGPVAPGQEAEGKTSQGSLGAAQVSNPPIVDSISNSNSTSNNNGQINVSQNNQSSLNNSTTQNNSISNVEKTSKVKAPRPDKLTKKQMKINEEESRRRSDMNQSQQNSTTISSTSPTGKGVPFSPSSALTAAPSAHINSLAPTPSLSWQCFNSVLFAGPEKHGGKSIPEGSIGIAPADMGCFSKSQHFPLVLTLPFTYNVREKYLKTLSQQNLRTSSSSSISLLEKLFLLQRQARSLIVSDFVEKSNSDLVDSVNALNQNPVGSGSMSPSFYVPPVNAIIPPLNPFIHPTTSFGADFLKELVPRTKYCRQKKGGKKDTRWDRDDRRKQTEKEKKEKAKNSEFLRAMLNHGADFRTFHKNKRTELTKLAKLAKTHIDSIEAKKEKDEKKEEVLRLKALKENDMEAYSRLVQDTKNDRLKYLLNETDSYLAAINTMIQQQRVDSLPGSESSSSSSSSSKGGSAKMDVDSPRNGDMKDLVKTQGNYMTSTHKVTESVNQPRMLKGGDLKEYQMTGLQWLVSLYNNNLNGILADEMGLGKTIQTIALLTYLSEVKHVNGPFMVVCPLSTLSNWTNEFARWAPDLITVVYKGLPDVRKKVFKDEIETGKFNVLLTTYEFIMKDKAMLKKLYWIYIIVDEGHRMKNADSKFTRILGAQYHSKHRVLLTGTPLQNSLPELWSLLNFLLPTIFSSVDTFDQWFNKPFAAFKEEAKEQVGDEAATGLNQEEQMLIVHRLHEVLRPFVLRRVKNQVLDQLPEKTERIIRCEFSGFQRKLYRSIQAKHLNIASLNRPDLHMNQGAVASINNVWMQLKKVCNHPYLFLNDYNIDDDIVRISGKFELLDRMLPKLQAAGHRVLLFSQMTQLMRLLEHFFMIRNMPFLRLDGSTTADEREKRMYEFNDPNSPYFIFMLSTRAGGLGLNLATADTVVIFDSDWNPSMDMQAQDRAHRIGQKNEVRVFRLITNSVIEEKILARATEKKNLNGLVVEAGKFNTDKREKEEETKQMMAELLKEWKASGYKDEEDTNKEKRGPGRPPAHAATAVAAAAAAASSTAVDKSENGMNVSASGGNEDADDAEEADNSDNDSCGDDNDVPDDEQLNKYMAINDREEELYRQMDRKREEQGRHLNRLMTFDTKPSWLTPDKFVHRFASICQNLFNLQHPYSAKNIHTMTSTNDFGEDEFEYREPEDAEADSVGPIVAGKLMRKRKSGVVYDDGMSEQQFMRAVEQAEDEEIMDARREQVEKAASMLKSRLEKAAVGPATPLRPSLISKVLGDRLNQNINEILKIKRNDGYMLCELFKDKPDRKFWPDYYKVVADPIALKDIQVKLKNKAYHRVEDLLNDFALMSHNARLFNTEQSPVFANAEGIRSEFFHRMLTIPFLVVENRDDFLYPPLPSQSEGYLVFPQSDETLFSDNNALIPASALFDGNSRPVIPSSFDGFSRPVIPNSFLNDYPGNNDSYNNGFDDGMAVPVKVPGKRGRKPNPEKAAAKLAALANGSPDGYKKKSKVYHGDDNNDDDDDDEDDQPSRSKPSLSAAQKNNQVGQAKQPMLILSLSKNKSTNDMSKTSQQIPSSSSSSSSSSNIKHSSNGPTLSFSMKASGMNLSIIGGGSGSAAATSGPSIRIGAVSGPKKSRMDDDGYLVGGNLDDQDYGDGSGMYDRGNSASHISRSSSQSIFPSSSSSSNNNNNSMLPISRSVSGSGVGARSVSSVSQPLSRQTSGDASDAPKSKFIFKA